MTERIRQVCEAFRIQGTYQSYEELLLGNINHTYKVKFRQDDGSDKYYIAQKVNTEVFRNPTQVMDNIDRITEHIHAKNPHKRVLHFHHTADRKIYTYIGDEFWRLFNYIPSKTYNTSQDLEIVRSAGQAFGEFQIMLRDFDANLLYETIPDFHDTKKRYEQLDQAVREDPLGRVSEVRRELDWLNSVREKACILTELREHGELPLRVTHNDTKINNVLFQREGKDAIVVIDLDTVMPGLVGHDFGDAIRSAANHVPEDCREPERAGVDLDIFRAFSEGFLSCTAAALTSVEVNTLAAACLGMTCELTTRFLGDYILGDVYFKTGYPGHNLDRARCQLALAQDMDRHMNEMEQIVHDCARQAGVPRSM